jgi:hypothetical protein
VKAPQDSFVLPNSLDLRNEKIPLNTQFWYRKGSVIEITRVDSDGFVTQTLDSQAGNNLILDPTQGYHTKTTQPFNISYLECVRKCEPTTIFVKAPQDSIKLTSDVDLSTQQVPLGSQFWYRKGSVIEITRVNSDGFVTQTLDSQAGNNFILDSIQGYHTKSTQPFNISLTC